MPTVDKNGVEIMFLEVYDQSDSGFVMDGTERTNFEQRLNKTTVTWVPTEGQEGYMDGKVKRFRKIRHIRSSELIYPLEQEKNGYVPNRTTDKIPIDNGFITIKREGSTIGTYDYLKASTYFFDNPFRPDTATPIYREIKVDENAVSLLDEDEMLTAAKTKVYALRLNINGTKNYKYDTDKISSYCNLLNVFAETPEQQLVLLLNKSITNPKNFLDTIVKAEQTVITEISHALQLKVIAFEKNTAQYTKEEEVITTVGTGNMSEIKKIEALASYLQTTEGNSALTKLRTRLEIEKELQFKA
jgi:hypothetical protein